MYFHSRTDAGEQLAQQLAGYRYENTAVVALSHAAIPVAAPIAEVLHSVLGLLLTDDISIPGENLSMGTIHQGGGFIYNQQMSSGEIQDYYGEYHGYIEDQKREKFARINHLLGEGGAIDASMLREHVVILVADGLRSGAVLEAAVEFLKPVKMKRLIIATPVASVEAVDRMHILGDEIQCLSVTSNYLNTAHYYDVNDIPSHEQAVDKINNIILKWR